MLRQHSTKHTFNKTSESHPTFASTSDDSDKVHRQTSAREVIGASETPPVSSTQSSFRKALLGSCYGYSNKSPQTRFGSESLSNPQSSSSPSNGKTAGHKSGDGKRGQRHRYQEKVKKRREDDPIFDAAYRAKTRAYNRTHRIKKEAILTSNPALRAARDARRLEYRKEQKEKLEKNPDLMAAYRARARMSQLRHKAKKAERQESSLGPSEGEEGLLEDEEEYSEDEERFSGDEEEPSDDEE